MQKQGLFSEFKNSRCDSISGTFLGQPSLEREETEASKKKLVCDPAIPFKVARCEYTFD